MCDINLSLIEGQNSYDVNDSNYETVKVQYSRGNFQFFRPNIEGSISFSNNSFEHIIASTKCCNPLPFKISQSGSTIIDFIVEPSGFNVDYKVNKLVSQSNKTLDYWRSIMFGWDEKINVLSFPRNERVLHKFVDEENPYIDIVNDKFYKLSSFIHIVVSETFKKINLGFLLPSTPDELSSLFTIDELPWTDGIGINIFKKRNILKNACIAQMSDFVRPKSAPATGVEEIGSKINESVAVTLKDLLEKLQLFELHPFIDSNNKFRIEHISYFQQGNSYDTTKVGLNLLLPEYIPYVSDFNYSYQSDNTRIYGKYALSITNNLSISTDEAAEKYFINDDVQFVTEKIWFKSRDYISKVEAIFDTECALRDDSNNLQEKTLSFDFFTTHYYGAAVDCGSNDINSWILLDCSNKDSSNIRTVNVDSNGIINGEMSAKSIFINYHSFLKPTSTFKIEESLFSTQSILKKQKLNVFKLPSIYLNKINLGKHNLPDGREFVIDSFYLNLQDNFLYITAYTDNNCQSVNWQVGTNGCYVKDLLVSSFLVIAGTYIDSSTGLIAFIMKNQNTYTDGNCGFYTKLEQ